MEQQQGPPDTCVDRVADRVLDVGFHKARDKVVARPGRVGPHENVASEKARVVAGLVTYLVLRREGTDHLVQQLEVIVGVVRAGVTRTEHRPERLYGRVAPGAEWVGELLWNTAILPAEEAFYADTGSLMPLSRE